MIEKFDPLKGEMLQILHPDGRLEEDLRPDLSDERGPGSLSGHDPDSGGRPEGLVFAAAGPNGDLPAFGPGSGPGGKRFCPRERGLGLPLLPGDRGPLHARRPPERHSALLDGRREGADSSGRRLRVPHFRPRGNPSPSRGGGGLGGQAPEGKNLHHRLFRGWGHLGGGFSRGHEFCRRLPDPGHLLLPEQPVRHLRSRGKYRLPRRPSPRRRSPTGSAASRWTGTTFSPCTPPRGRPGRRPSPGKGRP